MEEPKRRLHKAADKGPCDLWFGFLAAEEKLASVTAPNVVIASLVDALLLVAAINARSILDDRNLEITTSAARLQRLDQRMTFLCGRY